MNKRLTPPRWPLKFFRWYCHPDFMEDIEGDIVERFEKNAEMGSLKTARWEFSKDVIKLFRPGLIRSFSDNYQLNQIGMLKNFLKTGWRNFLKYKTNSVINVTGLSVGISATILLFLIINYERSFDKFHDGYENVFRIADKYPDGGYSDRIVTPVLPNLLEEYPDIASGTRVSEWDDMFLFEDKAINFSFSIVDPGFTDVFSFKSVQGDLKTALSKPGNIVLTSSTAKVLFGHESPIGKMVHLKDNQMDVEVAAVVEDPPSNSSINFEILMSWPASPNPLDEDQMGNWYNTFMTAYIKLSPGVSTANLEKKSAAFTDKFYRPERKNHVITLLPLEEEHARITENDKTVNILALIAIAILLVSCVNFMNLSISQSITRTKEIGIRKVMGSLKHQLNLQFLIEGMLTTSVAIGFSLVLVYFLAPLVSRYYNVDISLNVIENSSSLLLILLIALAIGLLSSLTGAMFLSGIKAIKSLKEKVNWSGTGQWMQKGLIVFQFATSLIFVAGTIVIWKQISYMKSFDKKFDGEYVVGIDTYTDYFKDPKKAKRQLDLFRTDLPRDATIEQVAFGESTPGKYWENYNSFEYVDSSDTKNVHLKQLTVDHFYFDLLNINIKHGRDFSSLIASDSQAVIINNAAMKVLGWNDLENKFLLEGGDKTRYQVVGVVEDYHYRSLKESIEPIIHFYRPDVFNKMLVKLNSNQIEEGLALLKHKWASLGPYQPFKYTFLDEQFDKLYKSQEKLGTTLTLFANIAVILALMGLFSITTFMIKNKRKEIGLRKVLGASTTSVIVMLSKRFAFLIGIAFLVAIPCIFYLSNAFLSDFTYRIDLPVSIFLIAIMIVFMTAMTIVGLQSGKAANENPVNALRD